jgi:uncharacterized protein YbcV (DUF1398 family)
MDTTTKQQIEELARKSNGGMLTFPESIGALIKLEVEAYYADFRKKELTYYTKQNQACTFAMPEMEVEIPLTLNPTELQAAIRAAQRDEIRYPEFKKRSMAAGCVGYFVWIAGKQVNYFGRLGELHVEKFPN